MKFSTFLATATAFGLVVAPAMARPLGQAAALSAKPVPVADLVKRVDIPFQQFVLANGLHVIVHTDRKAPVVAVSIWYNIGSKMEPKGKTGFAHLYEHLMFNGSQHSPGDFFEPLQQIGATDVNGSTWFDRTNYFETVPTPALERALFLESDRMGWLLPAMDKKKLDNQRGVVQNEKRQGDNEPFGLVEYAQTEALFPSDHPYGHTTIGSMADLDAASLDDVKAWFREHYGPNNAVLVLAGDIDVPTARRLVEKYFGNIPRGPAAPKVVSPVPTLAKPIEQVMTDRIATTRIYRDWIVPGLDSPESVPLSIGASVLGGLASSRLDNALVRTEKTAVAVSAGLQVFAQMGQFEVTVDVRPGADVDAVSKRLDAIIADLIAKGPTADEVERVKTRQVAARISGLESVGGGGGKAVTLAEGQLYSGDPGFYKKRLEALAATTPAQVQASLAKWLSRPVYALRVNPGERGAYQESTSVKAAGSFAPSYYRQPVLGEQPLAPLPKIGYATRPAPKGKPSVSASVGVDRSKLPPVGTIPDLKFPTVTRTKLSNGIEVVYAQRTALPVTRISLVFDAGNAADPKAKLGTQSLMLSLLEEGTTSLDSIQIAEAQERLGATISEGSSMDRTTVGLFALSPNLAPSLDLFADVVRNPAFKPDEIERLRVRQTTGIASELTQPVNIALRTLPPMLYGAAHPYGVPFTGSGEVAGVRAVTRDDLVAFHHGWIRPDKAQIFIVSDQSLATLKPMLEARFGNWQVTGAPGSKSFAAPIAPAKGRIVLVDRPGSPQSLILAGEILQQKGTDPSEALDAANDVMGGNFLSRLNTDLRETKGWSYGVESFLYRVRERVPFMVYAPVQTDQTGPSLAALIGDMKSFLSDKGVTADELTRTINGSIRELPGSFETSGAVLSAMQRNVLYERPDNYYDTLASKLRALSAAKLDQAARAAIRPDDMLWLVVGDAAKVRPQLDKLGIPVETLGGPPAAPKTN